MKHRVAMPGLVLCLFLLLLSLPAGAGQAKSSLQDLSLVVSLEWQPSSADTVAEAKGNTCSGLTSVNIVEILRRALDATSADVYGYSAGQVWISHYTLYSDGEHWDEADIRILASSDFRPTAYLGGLEKLSRVVPLAGGRKLTLNPGSIFLGRLWNGLTAECGDWDAPAGVQTISHELAHHILALGDSYAHNPGTGTFDYCSSTSAHLPDELAEQRGVNDSLLAYQYTAGRLRPETAHPSGCASVPQTLIYGTADWPTAKRLYGLTIPDPAKPLPSPPGLAQIDDLTQPAGNVASAVVVRDGPAGPALAYSMASSAGKTIRMLDQGNLIDTLKTPWLGIENRVDWPLLVARDWQSWDVFGTSSRPLSTGSTNMLSMKKLSWSTSVLVTPVIGKPANSTLTALDVHGQQCLGRTKQVSITFCPAGGACYETVLEPVINGTFKHRFEIIPEQQARMGAAHGYVYVSDASGSGQAAATYQLSGGFGPATAEIHSPLADGGVSVDLAPGSQVNLDGPTLLLTQSASACMAPLPAGALSQWPTLVQPYIVTPDGAIPWSRKDPQLYATLSYDPGQADNHQLQVLASDPGNPTAGWQRIQIVALDPALGLLTVDLHGFNGAGLVYTIVY